MVSAGHADLTDTDYGHLVSSLLHDARETLEKLLLSLHSIVQSKVLAEKRIPVRPSCFRENALFATLYKAIPAGRDLLTDNNLPYSVNI